MTDRTTAPENVPFVGRQDELKQLRQAFEFIQTSRKPLFVLVEGDYGAGKTALVERFLAEARAANRELLIGQGQCTAETEVTGLTPMTQLLVQLGGAASQRRIVSGQLLDFVKEVAPAWLDIVTLGAASAAVTTFEQGARLLGQGAVKQDSVFAQFTNALTRLAEKKPLVAFIDDMQWADASSLNLLFHLMRSLTQGAILFLCAYRPVEAMETGINADLFRTVRANLIRDRARQLEVMQGLDVVAYAAARYSGHGFPEAFLQNVQQHTGGHALYISELFSFWEENGVIVPPAAGDAQGRWSLAQQIDSLPIVPELTAVLDERIRRMEGTLSELLKVASVEGEDFAIQVLADVRQLDEYEVSEGLETLENRYRLIQEVGEREIASSVLDFYRFAQRFFRQHIYTSLSGYQQRTLHLQVAECLERLIADRKPIAGQLAHHFVQARQPLKAARYALLAAEVEQARYAWLEAEQWYDIGLEQAARLSSPAEEVAKLKLGLHESLARGLFYQGRYDRAVQEYRELISTAQVLTESPDTIGRLCAYMAAVCDELGLNDEGMAYIEIGKRACQDHEGEVKIVYLRLVTEEAILMTRLGETEKAIHILREALAESAKMPGSAMLDAVLVRTYDYYAIALGYLSRYDESIPMYHRSIDIARCRGDLYQEAVVLGNLADDYLLVGRPEEAESTNARALELAHRVGDRSEVAWSLLVKGRIDLARGRFHAAVQALEDSVALSNELAYDSVACLAHAELARTHLALSELEAARDHALRAVDYRHLSVWRRANALEAMGQVEAASKNWPQATECFEQSIQRYDQVGDRRVASRARCHYAQALIQAGDRDRAKELLNAALAVFQELGLEQEAAETARLLTEAG